MSEPLSSYLYPNVTAIRFGAVDGFLQFPVLI